jgi:nucleotide-binding universal stress UspA family protein
MTVVVGYRRSPEGLAALRFAVQEAGVHGDAVAVVHVYERAEDEGEWPSSEQDLDAVRALLEEHAVRGEIVEEALGSSVTDRILAAVQERGARMLVLGIRKRSPVGKLLLGSSAQQLIMDAGCPVVCVPAAGAEA